MNVSTDESIYQKIIISESFLTVPILQLKRQKHNPGSDNLYTTFNSNDLYIITQKSNLLISHLTCDSFSYVQGMWDCWPQSKNRAGSDDTWFVSSDKPKWNADTV